MKIARCPVRMAVLAFVLAGSPSLNAGAPAGPAPTTRAAEAVFDGAAGLIHRALHAKIAAVGVSMPARLAVAVEQIQRTRAYTLLYLDRTDEADWFKRPGGCPTHIAWQVGHLAVAEKFLLNDHVIGGDGSEALPPSFTQLFMRGATVAEGADHYPSPAQIRAALDGVHERMIARLSGIRDEDLDRPALRKHDLFETKLGAMLWCARHEMLHVGKIGLIRRMLGAAPIR
jgi:hypothetical protein